MLATAGSLRRFPAEAIRCRRFRPCPQGGTRTAPVRDPCQNTFAPTAVTAAREGLSFEDVFEVGQPGAQSAIECRDASKAFRRFHERNQTLKQAVIRRRRLVFEQHWAVRELTLDINQGETFGIIGGNGAGKSTTLKLLAGILVPDTGTVVTRGRVSALLELGAGFHPELSGRENVFLNGAILGIRKRVLQDRFDEIVEFSGLQASIDNPVKTYSSGMYARLGFSIAVNVDPDILLIDEVLSVGDEEFQRRCTARITELRSQGRTVVIVSHALGSMRTMCDRVAWFSQGRLAAIGPTAEVIDGYLTSVHPTAVIDDAGRTRTGTGDARVDVFVGGSLVTGDAANLTFRVTGTSAGPHLLRFVLRRTDGVVVGGSSLLLDTLSGPTDTKVSYEIPRLSLNVGTFDVAIALTDPTGGHVIDDCEHAKTFDVKPGVGGLQLGAVELFGAWSSMKATTRT
jgi:ABC-2 type transport system ATP-binding protein